MRFTLRRTSEDGDLPLIAELPNYPVARLEGANGIGKTVTIRILELCSGQRPNLNADQWLGLCDGLGTVDVAATELEGCESIHWVLSGSTLLQQSAAVDPAVEALRAARTSGDSQGNGSPAPRRLGEQRRAAPDLDWFDAVELDGRPVESMQTIRELLVVERIGGEAGLVQTIASYGEEQGELAAKQLESQLPFELADGAGRLLDAAELTVGAIDVDSLRQRDAAHRELQERLDEARRLTTEATTELHRRRDLVQLAARIEQQVLSAPELDRQITELDERIAELEGEQATASARIAELESTIADTDAVRKELRTAERTYKSQNTRMTNLAEELATERRLAGVGPDVDPLKRARQLREELDEATRARDAVDARPAINKLIDRILPLVEERREAGQGNQLLIVTEGADEGLSVAETAEGMERRRTTLQQPVDDEAAPVLADEVRRLQTALQACVRIPDLLKQFKGASDARKAAEDRQREAAKLLAEPAAARLEAERRRRRELSDAIVEAAADRAILHQRRQELGSPEQIAAAREQLTVGLSELGIAEDQLEPEFKLALARFEAEQQALLAVQDDAKEAEAALGRASAELNAVLATMRSEEFAWLALAAVAPPEGDAPLETRLQFITRLQPAVSVAASSLAIRQLGPQIRAAVQQVIADLLGQEDLGVRGTRVPAVRASLQRHIAAQFDVAEVRDPLLGPGAHELEVNLQERTMEWVDAGGQQHKRPLEGFSSGEQAFSFTQARLALASRASRTAANRLIALDEFGAFVSGQRLRALRAFLESWSERGEGIQLVLILPARDFEDLAARAAPRERERYAELAETMKDPGYFVEPLAAQ